MLDSYVHLGRSEKGNTSQEKINLVNTLSKSSTLREVCSPFILFFVESN